MQYWPWQLRPSQGWRYNFPDITITAGDGKILIMALLCLLVSTQFKIARESLDRVKPVTHEQFFLDKGR